MELIFTGITYSIAVLATGIFVTIPLNIPLVLRQTSGT